MECGSFHYLRCRPVERQRIEPSIASPYPVGEHRLRLGLFRPVRRPEVGDLVGESNRYCMIPCVNKIAIINSVGMKYRLLFGVKSTING